MEHADICVCLMKGVTFSRWCYTVRSVAVCNSSGLYDDLFIHSITHSFTLQVRVDKNVPFQNLHCCSSNFRWITHQNDKKWTKKVSFTENCLINFHFVLKDCEDHAVLLCSLLLGFGLNAFVCVGTKAKGAAHTWVMTISPEGEVTFWESLTAHRYSAWW